LLAFIALILSGMVAWERGWRPEQALAHLDQAGWQAYVVESISQLPAQSGPSQVASVVMVTSNVVNNPRSRAYTADLHAFAGKDAIPWPNVAGRTKILIYEVQSGDSLWGIAEQFELDLDTLRWSNPELERNPDVLSVGTKLRILPVPGIYHLIAEGDTLESIAGRYGVAPADITGYPPNALFPPYDLKDKEGVIIPFGHKDIHLPQPGLSSGYALAWPLVSVVSGGFTADHPAIDIGAPYGSTVYAADDGLITYAGWAQDGFGYTVVIDHGDGRQTWYNHLKGTLLAAGNTVSRGTPIGEVGSTGHSTGPHLHFELHVNGERVDPQSYLPTTPQ
jgi:murein DD-endopeptidase MepM/ murein hydrolase activator NlpD